MIRIQPIFPWFTPVPSLLFEKYLQNTQQKKDQIIVNHDDMSIFQCTLEVKLTKMTIFFKNCRCFDFLSVWSKVSKYRSKFQKKVSFVKMFGLFCLHFLKFKKHSNFFIIILNLLPYFLESILWTSKRTGFFDSKIQGSKSFFRYYILHWPCKNLLFSLLI